MTGPPDVLVLGGGGVLGEAWMNAVLAGLDEPGGFDARESHAFVGTSAGSIVATALAAGVRPGERLGRLPEQPPVAERELPGARLGISQRVLEAAAGLWSTAAAPLASLALSSTAAGGAVLRRAALARVPAGRRSLAELREAIEELGVRWDGRLLISAVELESGRRVMFGAPGAPELRVADAVLASCAIPGVFRPVRAGGRSYVDGGAWSPTNMDAAEVVRGSRVLCLNPTGSMRPTIAEPAGAIGPVSRSVAAAEALALRRRGASVTTINPDRASVAAMGTNLMDRGPRAAVIAAGLAQGGALARAGELRFS
ncbi:MAG: patatin-like phospholipase family protein [Thermoleophilaceae bacterium]